MGAPFCLLAAAAVVVAATATAVIGVGHAVAAAVAEQQDQDDDPPHIATAEIIVAHKKYLLIWFDGFAVHSMIFPMAKKVRWEAGKRRYSLWFKFSHPLFSNIFQNIILCILALKGDFLQTKLI